MNTPKLLLNYAVKFKSIIPVYLLLWLLTSLVLVVARWLFTIQFRMIDLNEDVWQLWLPIILTLVVLAIWFRQKLNILTFKNDNGSFGLLLIAAIGFAASVIIQQIYFSTATGKLATLENVEEFNADEPARFYTFKNFEVATNYGGAYTDFRTSGKYNQFLDIAVFVAYPIVADTAADVAEAKLWYGVKFTEQIGNKISYEEQDSLYALFYDECLLKLENYPFYAASYFERTPKSADRENFLQAIKARTEKETDETFVVLEPQTEAFESRNGSTFSWIFYSFGIGLGVLLFILIWPGYDQKEHQRLLAGGKPLPGDLEDFLNYLIPKDDHFATSLILDLNILVFLAMVFSGVNFMSPNAQELLAWGANERTQTANGEWWRLLTNIFVHGGFMHLALNCVGLALAGIFIEPIFGRLKTLLLYLFAGFCASIASTFWYVDGTSVGASGAIFGLFGAALGLLITKAYPKREKKSILIFVGVYVLINLLWGLTGGVDNAAHVGGLFSGAIFGVLLFKLKKQKPIE